jgi:hypothetical protein
LLTRVVSTSVTRSADVHGYTTAFEVSALLVAMAAVVAGVLIGTKRSHHVPEAESAPWVDNSPRFAIEEVPSYRIGQQSDPS